MPEGPEVTFLTMNLKKIFLNSILEKVINYNYNKKLLLDTNTLHNTLPSKIIEIGNIGKTMFFILENNYCFTIQLGLIGNVNINIDDISHDKIFESFDRIKFITNKGSFTYNSTINYGLVTIFASIEELQNKLNKLGFDLAKLDKISNKAFQDELLKYKNFPISEVLLNQSFVAGVGNYIRAEALYFSRIHPMRKVSSLSEKEINLLKKNLFLIFRRSLDLLLEGKQYEFQIYMKPTASKLKTKNRTIYFDKNIQI